MFLQLQGHHSPREASPASFQPSVVHGMWAGCPWSGGLPSVAWMASMGPRADGALNGLGTSITYLSRYTMVYSKRT